MAMLPWNRHGSICARERDESSGDSELTRQGNGSDMHFASEFSLCSRSSVADNKRRILKNIAAFLFLCNLSVRHLERKSQVNTQKLPKPSSLISMLKLYGCIVCSK